MNDTDPIRGPDGGSDIALGAVEFIARVRDTYVDQFEAFAEHQVAEGIEGASEIKLELERSDGVLKQLYCADFMMASGDGYEPILFQAESQLFFEPFEARVGAIDITFASFGWDGIEIRYESALTAEQILDDWHDYWFDPDDRRRDPDAFLSGSIHNVNCDDQTLLVSRNQPSSGRATRCMARGGSRRAAIVNRTSEPAMNRPPVNTLASAVDRVTSPNWRRTNSSESQSTARSRESS